MSTKVIKHVSTVTSPVLCNVIVESVFPNKLKITIIKPVFKSGDTEEMSYYRPIALITIFLKIFQRAILYIIS